MAGRRIVLMDSASLYFRAFFGVKAPSTTLDGRPSNAVRGLADMIATLIDRFSPDLLVACWDDDWRPQWRVELVPSYKAHRVAEPGSEQEEVPDALTVQVPLIEEMLELAGIPRVGAAGYEADDVVATLAEQAAAAGDRTIVISGDRDLFQLVDDARRIAVAYAGKGLRDAPVVDQGWLAERYGVPDGERYADLAALRGDPSDGLPGVTGIGEKTAAALLARYGDLDAVLRAARGDDRGITARQRVNLLVADHLQATREVIEARRDAPVSLPGPGVVQTELLTGFGQRAGVPNAVSRLLRVLPT